jgi:hypothetical protein
MRALFVLCILPVLAMADSSSLNLQLPNGSQNYQSDKFRADNLDCSNAIGGSTNVEFGVTGIVGAENGTIDGATKDIGVYARIIVPLDGPKERINCNTLYQLELQKKRLEVQKLKQELNNLRNLQKGFEN